MPDTQEQGAQKLKRTLFPCDADERPGALLSGREASASGTCYWRVRHTRAEHTSQNHAEGNGLKVRQCECELRAVRFRVMRPSRALNWLDPPGPECVGVSDRRCSRSWPTL